MTDLRVASEGSGAAAWRVAQDEIEASGFQFGWWVGHVGQKRLHMFCGFGAVHAFPHGFQTLWADVAGDDFCLRMTDGQHGGFAAGCGAAVEDSPRGGNGGRSDFGDEA